MLTSFNKFNCHTSSISSSVISPITHTVPLDLTRISLTLLQQHQIHNKLPLFRRKNYTSRLDYDLDFQLHQKVVYVMVGLPAAGKSTVSKQLNQYFNKFTQLNSKIYNAGDVRRDCQEENDANFFNPDDERAKLMRENYVNITIGNLISDLNENIINIGFLDATNSTMERRKRMIDKINDEVTNPMIILLNVSNNNPDQSNFNIACKSKNADYSMKNYHDSINDFKVRIDNYLKAYQPITTNELSNYSIDLYINFENGGEVFDISRYNTINVNFSNVLDKFVGRYAESFGKVYLKRVEEWMVFIEGLDDNNLDSDVIKQNLKAELQNS